MLLKSCWRSDMGVEPTQDGITAPQTVLKSVAGSTLLNYAQLRLGLLAGDFETAPTFVNCISRSLGTQRVSKRVPRRREISAAWLFATLP
jgi:hypothetical protein